MYYKHINLDTVSYKYYLIILLGLNKILLIISTGSEIDSNSLRHYMSPMGKVQLENPFTLFHGCSTECKMKVEYFSIFFESPAQFPLLLVNRHYFIVGIQYFAHKHNTAGNLLLVLLFIELQ